MSQQNVSTASFGMLSLNMCSIVQYTMFYDSIPTRERYFRPIPDIVDTEVIIYIVCVGRKCQKAHRKEVPAYRRSDNLTCGYAHHARY